MWNSIFVSWATTVIGVAIAVPAAYAFSRFRFPGRKFMFFAVLFRNMFPAVVFLMPLFIMMRFFYLVNTHTSLILTYLTFGLPLSIWLLKGFYDNIPIELTDGDIYIGDRLVIELDPKDRDVAMVFQNYALYPNKTEKARPYLLDEDASFFD